MAGRIHGILVLPPQPVSVATDGQMYYTSGFVYYYNGSATLQLCPTQTMFATVMANTYWRW